MTEGKVACIDAILQALSDASVDLITFVPGYPVTEIADALGDAAQISVNEKVALEIALGASSSGSRAMVLVKNLGMNLLADPLSISATHTIGAGLVVMVGDDVGPRGSQIELDSRYYGAAFELPLLDPGDPIGIYSAIGEAYQLSEAIRAPVVVRITNKLIEDRSEGSIDQSSRWTREGAGKSGRPKPPKKKFDRAIWELTSHGRHQRYYREALPIAEEASERTSLNIVEVSSDIGIIASGRAGRLALDLGTSLLVPIYAYPLPWGLIRSFIDKHRRILVAEEAQPFIESQLRISDKVCGKLTGHLPFGGIEASDLKRAIDEIDRPAQQIYSLQKAKDFGTKRICEDCPYIQLYEAISDIDVPVAGDAGCNFLAVRRPFEAVDLVYGLGSSIGVASGFDRKGIALIGDYALAHSGLQGLINADWQKRSLLVVLLENSVAAMSGGQPVPSYTHLLEAIVPETRQLQLPAPAGSIKETIEAELARPGISALVASARCPRFL